MYFLTETEIEQIRGLAELGWSGRRIAREIGKGETCIRKQIDKFRAEGLNKSYKKDQVTSLLASRATPIEVARATHMPIATAKSWIGKVEGTKEPVEQEIKLELSRGTSLFKMMNRFGVSSMLEVDELIRDTFDNVFVYKRDHADGDVSIVLIPDRSNQFDWLDKPKTFEPKFKYFVNPDNNYMFVQFDDDLPDEIKVYNFTDLHIGSKFCRTELLKQHIKMVAEDDSAFTLLGGDIFDYMHKQSVGQPWEQKLAPMEQVSCSARMLMPLAHKNIRYVGGNHDYGRGYKPVGADLAECLAYLLRTSYGVMETVIDMQFKGHLFTAILHHGSGRGNSIQAILNEAESYRKTAAYFANWHLSGHVHQAFAVPRNCVRKVEGKGLIPARYWTVIGGSYMERTGSYAEETKYGVTPQDLSYITMRADGSYGAGAVEIDAV